MILQEQRSQFITKLSGFLFREGLALEAAEAVSQASNKAVNVPPLDEKTVTVIVRTLHRHCQDPVAVEGR